MSLRNISFSNNDTEHLQYASFTNSWDISGTYEATSTGQSGTLSSTKDNSANVTFKFPQAATAVYYYGIRRCCGGFYAVCIDCNPNATLTNDPSTGFQTIDAVNRTDDGKNPPVVLWSQTFPSPAVHTVVLTNQLDDRFHGNSQITVASFVIQVEDDTSPASASTSLAGVTSITSMLPSATGQHSSSGIPLKPFLVGLLGGMMVLVLLILAITMWYRQRRRINHTKTRCTGGIPSSVASTGSFTSRDSCRTFVTTTKTSWDADQGKALGADYGGEKRE
ncbi:hypothetical protein GYMLUDRAFT_613803 [Collybiopsis luxurians FD-317 M1]|uniref:Uncharacterized protein n=1 Tax=Collybiopsis luxurians FD-317 M1 TaxID=944289 RepID=A0A0D0CCB2_9AGAR|nr:hypothetical protein GYMLUDRAFT_613803 [Collybiopsis luxurians FD-317 M1]